jgi:hypothetical protein
MHPRCASRKKPPAGPDRRGLLLGLAGAGLARAWPSLLAAAGAASCRTGRGREESTCDVAVVGGSLGACAAALAASRDGARTLLLAEGPWLGGALTSQAVPPDEHAHIENHGSSASYRALRRAIRDHYRIHWPLTPAARESERLNPGLGWVSRLCCEPRAALAGIEALLAPEIASGRLRIELGAHLRAAQVERDRIRSLRFDAAGGPLWVGARIFVDGSEAADLVAAAGAEHVTGSEAQHRTGEPHADPQARPGNLQAATWVLAMEHVEGADFRGSAPPGYAAWSSYVPALEPPWPGPLFSLWTTHPRTRAARELGFSPLDSDAERVRANLWSYRRVRCAASFEAGPQAREVTLVNWPQNDYLMGDTWDPDPAARERHRRGARELSLCLLHWLQTAAPRPDGGQGWPGLRACPEVSGTADGLAMEPYARESRRILAETTLVEQDLEPNARAKELGVDPREAKARAFDDSIGLGWYGELDLHPSVGGDNYRSLGCLPFQLPLGCLIPVRLDNLLPGCKNAGTTHITNGVCRLHPVEWVLGEVAGALAARCVALGCSPRAVRASPVYRLDFQAQLARLGVDLAWP